MATPSRPKPPRINICTRIVYRIIPSTSTAAEIQIHSDILLPTARGPNALPIMLYIHGGGWIHSNSEDYPIAVLQHFLDRGFIVCSMEYRLCPESSFEEQCDDVRFIEGWLRNGLEGELEGKGFEVKVNGRKTVVVGSSCGAHLALLTVFSFSLSFHKSNRSSHTIESPFLSSPLLLSFPDQSSG